MKLRLEKVQLEYGQPLAAGTTMSNLRKMVSDYDPRVECGTKKEKTQALARARHTSGDGGRREGARTNTADTDRHKRCGAWKDDLAGS